jgi:anti-sigma regulatory factor (Ser/Thr protein kinase)
LPQTLVAHLMRTEVLMRHAPAADRPPVASVTRRAASDPSAASLATTDRRRRPPVEAGSTWRFDFAGVPSDLPLLRTQLTAIFLDAGWPPEQLTDMLLAADELATNAIVHAGTGFSVACTVGPRATIEVEDGNPQVLPWQRAPDSAEPGGFGLHIVNQLAREWSVEIGDHTKLVRAVFDRPGAPSTPEAV